MASIKINVSMLKTSALLLKPFNTKPNMYFADIYLNGNMDTKKADIFTHIYCWGWSGGAKVLGKLSVLGRPTSLDDSRARAYCACSRCGWGLFGHFFLSSIFSLFFLSLFGRRPDID